MPISQISQVAIGKLQPSELSLAGCLNGLLQQFGFIAPIIPDKNDFIVLPASRRSLGSRKPSDQGA